MGSAVLLTVLKGTLTGERFVFDESETWMVGRSAERDLRLPATEHTAGGGGRS
jgi:hypothetical protein